MVRRHGRFQRGVSPTACLAWLIGLHLVVWTALPALVNRNLQLDLAEGLVLGREWQLGLLEASATAMVDRGPGVARGR